jgi:hypothetical protein
MCIFSEKSMGMRTKGGWQRWDRYWLPADPARYRYGFQTGRSASKPVITGRPVITDPRYLLFWSYYLINNVWWTFVERWLRQISLARDEIDTDKHSVLISNRYRYRSSKLQISSISGGWLRATTNVFTTVTSIFRQFKTKSSIQIEKI